LLPKNSESRSHSLPIQKDEVWGASYWGQCGRLMTWTVSWKAHLTQKQELYYRGISDSSSSGLLSKKGKGYILHHNQFTMMLIEVLIAEGWCPTASIFSVQYVLRSVTYRFSAIKSILML
jgi:hypothetical protein